MRTRTSGEKGRRAARLSLLLCLLVLAGAGLAFKDTALEYWWIHKLGSEDPTEVRNAAEKLGAMHSRKAIPHLVKAVQMEKPVEEHQPGAESTDIEVIDATPLVALLKIGPEGLSAFFKSFPSESQVQVIVFKPQELEPELVPLLIACLRDESQTVRQKSTAALAGMDPETQTIFRALLSALKDPEKRVRLAAARALCDTHPELKAVRNAVLDSLKDPDRRLRVQALEVLNHVSVAGIPMTDALIETLRDEDGEIRRQAVTALERQGSFAAQAIPVLVELLDSSSGEAQEEIAGAIETISLLLAEDKRAANAEASVPGILERLKKYPFVGYHLLGALQYLGPSAKPAVKGLAVRALVECLSNPSLGLTIQAASALAWFGTDGEPATPALVELLKDPYNADLVKTAARTLASIGPTAKKAAPSLLGLLSNHGIKEDVRSEAAKALAAVRPEAKETEAALREVLEDNRSSSGLRGAAVQAWTRLHLPAEELLPLLLGALKDSDGFVRSSAAKALADLGPKANACVPALRLTASADAHEGVRVEAAKALWQVNRDANAVVPLLTAAIDNYSIEDICDLLTAIGPEAEEAVPKLIELAGPENSDFVRDHALAALSRIAPDTDAIAPVVVDFLEAGDLSFCGKPAVRWVLQAWPGSGLRARLRIIETLAKIGPDAAEAVPALRRLLEDADEVVRVEAAEALEKIEGQWQLAK